MMTAPSGGVRRVAGSSLVLVLAIGAVLVAPPPAEASTRTTREAKALVERLAGLVTRLSAAERQRLPKITADIATLRSDAARADRTNNARLAATVRTAINRISLGLAELPPSRVRTSSGSAPSPAWAIPTARARARTDTCTGEWLSTRSPNFHNIRKLSYLNTGFEFPQGVQINASFVAERDDTIVAAIFSAEAYVDDDSPGLGRRMFVRALSTASSPHPRTLSSPRPITRERASSCSQGA